MEAFVREAFTLLGIGLFVIGLRLSVRISAGGLKGLHPDDYLMVVAAVVYSIETYLAYSVGAFWHGLANNAMTDEQRRLLDPGSEEYHLRVNGSKTQVAGWSTYTFLLWVIKAAMCTFYLRLTDGLGMEKRIYAGFVLIVTTWIAVLFSILFGCYPLEKNWQIYPDPGNACQPAISNIDIFVTVVLNVITDLYLLSIPIPMLWGSSLRPMKKAGLIFIFSGGIFVTAAGILRCVLIVTDPINGAQQAGSWAVRETFVAVVTSNLPMISSVIAKAFRPILGTLRSLSTSAHHNKPSKLSGSDGDMGFHLENKNPRRGMGPRSVHPIPNFTMNGSDEEIYGGAHDGDSHTTAYDDTDLEAGHHHHHNQPQPPLPLKTLGSITTAVTPLHSPISPVIPPQSPSVREGVIVKQTSVEVVETTTERDSMPAITGRQGSQRTAAENVGDYYLVRQSQRDAERLAELAGQGQGQSAGLSGIGALRKSSVSGYRG